jgi:flagellin-specific chaperone FliS
MVDNSDTRSPIRGVADSCRCFDACNLFPAVEPPEMTKPDAIELFLRQEVESASPAKLHFLLLQKAHGLSILIGDLWRKQDYSGAAQWVILVRDILSELLAGIVDSSHPLAKQQSDLYVFLSKLLIAAELDHDVIAVDNMREILDIEKTTWEMLVRREQLHSAPPTVSSNASFGSSFDFSA